VWRVKSEVIDSTPTAKRTKNFAQAFIKACDGVKGARSPLSLSAESETPLKKANSTSNVKKKSKVKNPKAQFAKIRKTS
jgi:hypothetical protein